MAGACSKISSHLRSCSFLGSPPSLRHLLSSPATTDCCPRFLASLHCSLPLAHLPFQFHRQFSASSSGDDSELWGLGESTRARIELDDLTSSGLNEVAGRVTGAGSILPVGSLTSLLDHYHDLTGFPWLVFLSSSFFIQDILLTGKLCHSLSASGNAIRSVTQLIWFFTRRLVYILIRQTFSKC